MSRYTLKDHGLNEKLINGNISKKHAVSNKNYDNLFDHNLLKENALL